MNLSMDLSQQGLHMFFKDWQVLALQALWGSSEALNSREVCDAINEKTSISRASVINFLEASYENGLLERETTTGKGGHYGLYTAKYDEQGTKDYLKKLFTERLNKL